MKYLAPFLILAVCFTSLPLKSAEASEMPRDDSEWSTTMTLTLAALTVPLGVNTYSAISESPVAPLWHWSGYGIGGLTVVMGALALADVNGGDDPVMQEADDSSKTWIATGFIGYGLCHIAAAYFASDIKPESNAGLLAPMVSVGEQGERQLGLTWMKRF